MGRFKSLPLSESDLQNGYLSADLLDEHAKVQSFRARLQARLAQTDRLAKDLNQAIERDFGAAQKRGYDAGFDAGMRAGKAEFTKAMLEVHAQIGAELEALQAGLSKIATDAIRQAFYGLDLSDQVAIAVSSQMDLIAGSVGSQIYVHPDHVETLESLIENADLPLSAALVVHADPDLDREAVEMEIGSKLVDVSPRAQLEQALQSLVKA